jgi:hypothetical protein
VPEEAVLEQQLLDLVGEISWPSTPDISARVATRLAAPTRIERQWFQQRWALAAAIAIAVIAALLVYNPSREAIANWINVHVLIQRVTTLPSPSPRPSGSVGDRLALGRLTTLDEAQRSVKWKITVPSSLGPPDLVYILQPPGGPPGTEVTLVYLSVPGIKTAGETDVAVLVTEARGQVDTQFFGKMIGAGTNIEPVTVGGHSGYWISGEPHIVYFRGADGTLQQETLRLATNTLLLDVDGTLVRIEGNLTKDQAVQIAESIR